MINMKINILKVDKTKYFCYNGDVDDRDESLNYQKGLGFPRFFCFKQEF